ncbi:MAG: aminoglycoside phosphotransferase family protein [Verrucomicrobiota bacterium]
MNLPSQIDAILREAGVDFQHLTCLPMDRSHTGRQLFLVLVFKNGEPSPFALFKVARTDDDREALQREFANLERLRDAGVTSVPAPLYCTERDGFFFLAESVGEGTRMKNRNPDRYFSSSDFPKHFDAVSDWLLAFHQALGEPVESVDRRVTEALSAYRERFKVSPDLDRLLDSSAERLMEGIPTLSPVHGDFCTANILVSDRGQIFVIDWENPMQPSWPLKDLIHFSTSIWCMPYRKGEERLMKNIKELWTGRTSSSRMIRAKMEHALTQLQLDPSLALPLQVMVWVDYANEKMDYFQRANAGKIWRPLIILKDRSCLNLEWLAGGT